MEALIGAMPTEAGGKRSSMQDGYRPSHDFGLLDELNDGHHEYPESGCVAPGETGRAHIWLLAPERQTRRLFPGFIFNVQEGSHVVGQGRVLRILNEDLRAQPPVRLEIDGSRILTLESFYEEVTRVLVPRTYWGHNLDAFNDILRGGFGTPDDGFHLVWRNHAQSRLELGYPETARQLEQRLANCHPANRERVSHELAEARAGRGSTAFDWLLQIIEDHGPGGEEASDEVHLILD